MQKYLGVKIIHAESMNLGEYNKLRGWTIPENEDPAREGYKVVYPDGYVSWSPKEVFEDAYREIDGLTFGLAIESAKKGHKVARAGWNGKGMFIVYQKGYPQGIPCNKQTAEAWGMSEGDLFKCEPYLQMKMATGSHFMYTPNTLDVLAEDWMVIE